MERGGREIEGEGGGGLSGELEVLFLGPEDGASIPIYLRSLERK